MLKNFHLALPVFLNPPFFWKLQTIAAMRVEKRWEWGGKEVGDFHPKLGILILRRLCLMPLAILAKITILDFWVVSQYTSSLMFFTQLNKSASNSFFYFAVFFCFILKIGVFFPTILYHFYIFLSPFYIYFIFLINLAVYSYYRFVLTPFESSPLNELVSKNVYLFVCLSVWLFHYISRVPD